MRCVDSLSACEQMKIIAIYRNAKVGFPISVSNIFISINTMQKYIHILYVVFQYYILITLFSFISILFNLRNF